MFQRKLNLPSRPKMPTVSQIIEDITATTDDDPLFTAVKKLSVHSYPPKDNTEQDVAYQKIKSFLELNEHLLINMKNLDVEVESLKNADVNLNQYLGEVKEEAKRALI